MNWLLPIGQPYVKPSGIRRSDGAEMPFTGREVICDGVRYPSMAAACRALRCSYSAVYKRLGEAWRYEKKPRGD